MNKKICAILAVTLILTAVGCSNQDEVESLNPTSKLNTEQNESNQHESDEISETEKYEEKSVVEDEPLEITEPTGVIYTSVIEEYADMVRNDFYTDLQNNSDYDKYDNSFGEHIGKEIRANKRGVFYAFYDVDGNGIDEMIIAGAEEGVGVASESFIPWNYDIYSFDGKQVVHLFTETDFGYKTNFSLLEKGIIKVSFSGSATESGIGFYLIDSDGITPKLVDSFSKVGPLEGDNTKWEYYQYDTTISEEDYHEKIQSYGIDNTNIEWVEIY